MLVPVLMAASADALCREHPSKCVETPRIRTGKDQKQAQGMELPPIAALRCVPQQLSPEKGCGLHLFVHLCSIFNNLCPPKGEFSSSASPAELLVTH